MNQIEYAGIFDFLESYVTNIQKKYNRFEFEI